MSCRVRQVGGCCSSVVDIDFSIIMKIFSGLTEDVRLDDPNTRRQFHRVLQARGSSRTDPASSMMDYASWKVDELALTSLLKR